MATILENSASNLGAAMTATGRDLSLSSATGRRRLRPPRHRAYGDTLLSTDPALRWEIRGRRNAAFTIDFDYRSDT